MSKAKEKPLPAYSHDSVTQTDSAGNPTHITHYKEGKVIGHTYLTYDATTGNIKNMWSDFRPRLRPMPVPVILLDKNMLIGNFPTDYPDASVLTELQQKLETADLSLEAVTKYLNVNIKNFPADYPDASVLTELQQKLETADLSIEAATKYLNANVKNFPADYPDASALTELQQKLETADLSIEAATKYLNVNVKTLPNVTLASQVNPFSSNLPIDIKAFTASLPAGTNNIGDVDVLTLPTITQSTKHDAKTYKTAVFDASASGNLVGAVAGKVIKLHALTIQAQGTVVVNLNNGSGGASLMEWSFQAREGAVIPMANAPAYWAITSVNTALYVTLSAAVTVTITAIYSDDDAS